MPLPPIDLKGADILIVDDNPVNLKVLRQVLEEAGYNVLIATNGHSALKLATQAKPDAIMLDVRMPVMDGDEMLQKLFERYGR